MTRESLDALARMHARPLICCAECGQYTERPLDHKCRPAAATDWASIDRPGPVLPPVMRLSSGLVVRDEVDG